MLGVGRLSKEWDLSHLPPPGHPDVGPFLYQLYQDALRERDGLMLPQRWRENHRLYRGQHWSGARNDQTKGHYRVTANLIFTNIERTVANLTAKQPIAEVHSVDGITGQIDAILRQKMKNQWSETNQGSILDVSAHDMEIYGTVVEKHVADLQRGYSRVVPCDIYSILPFPGYGPFDDLPGIIHQVPMHVKLIEKIYGATEVSPDDSDSTLGRDRDQSRPYLDQNEFIPDVNLGGVRYSSAQKSTHGGNQEDRALVLEFWIRDFTEEEVEVVSDVKVVYEDPATGVPLPSPMTIPTTTKSTQTRYPGGIRKITITNQGQKVLDDQPNPNVNPAIERRFSASSHLFWNFPFTVERSLTDSSCWWGFSNIEQVADLQLQINEILSRAKHYTDLCFMPILVVPMDCGISDDKITNRAGLLLRPDSAMAGSGIHFLAAPGLPPNIMQLINLDMMLFDRVYAIQDIDRGEAPRNVIAASAIMALQERNATLMKHKIAAVDRLITERGRASISFYQNFGIYAEPIMVNGQAVTFRGVDAAGRLFNYAVDAGSTYARTEAQTKQMLIDLYRMNAIGRQGLLKGLGLDNWRELIEEIGEGMLNQAIQVLMQAGMPEEQAKMLQQQLMMPQYRNQGAPQGQQQPEAGVQVPAIPRAQQGSIPEVQNAPV